MPVAEPEVHAGEHDPHLANTNLAAKGGRRCVEQMYEIYSESWRALCRIRQMEATFIHPRVLSLTCERYAQIETCVYCLRHLIHSTRDHSQEADERS